MCVYCFCIALLQEMVAMHRSPGSFGWSLLGIPSPKEEDADKALSNEQLVDEAPYGAAYALDPFKWMKHWREFHQLAYQKSRSDEFNAFIEFDIANFHDSINLEILDRKIRERCGS